MTGDSVGCKQPSFAGSGVGLTSVEGLAEKWTAQWTSMET